MKIVHLCLSSVYLDDHSYQENILPKFHVKLGYEVTVISSLIDKFDSKGNYCATRNCKSEYYCNGFKVIRLEYKNNNIYKYLRVYKNLIHTLEKEKPDIIFIHDFSFLDISSIIKYLKNNLQIQVFVDCHTDFINSGKTIISKYLFHYCIWRYYAKKLNKYVIKFFGVTPLRCDFLINTYKIPTRKVNLLIMGIDDDLIGKNTKEQDKFEICHLHNIPNGNTLIVTGGKIDENKNIHLLLNSFKLLDSENVSLLIFGSVNANFEDEFNHLCNIKNVTFIKWQSAESIMKILNAADLAVFPGTHSVLWEQAVGIGTPCIFKEWNGMKHINHNNNCILIKDINEKTLSKALKEILTDNNLEILKSRAKSKSRINFHYSNIALKSINKNE